MTKRPWSAGPWDYRNIAMSNYHYEHITEDRKLASKAPEMAELLIRMVDPRINNHVDRFSDLVLDANKLLKECGYDPTISEKTED